MEDKASLRKFYLAKRRELKNISQLSSAICDSIVEFLRNQSEGLYWASYRAFGSEVDLSRLNKQSNFVYPRITSSGNMEFYLASVSTDEWRRSEFGFLEPKVGKKKVELKDLGGVLCPGVAFDYYGNRIGYGKGYYDKVLADYKGIKIGICFSNQISKELFKCASPSDVPMDYIITDKGLYESRSKIK